MGLTERKGCTVCWRIRGVRDIGLQTAKFRRRRGKVGRMEGQWLGRVNSMWVFSRVTIPSLSTCRRTARKNAGMSRRKGARVALLEQKKKKEKKKKKFSNHQTGRVGEREKIICANIAK